MKKEMAKKNKSVNLVDLDLGSTDQGEEGCFFESSESLPCQFREGIKHIYLMEVDLFSYLDNP
jgi:hypothetical protein